MEYLEPFRDDDLTVTISELLVATADSSDPLLDDSVSQLLQAMRQRMEMDVVFVSEFVDGQRMFRYVDAAPGAPAHPARRFEPGRGIGVPARGRRPRAGTRARPRRDAAEDLPDMPFRIGAHLSTPIVLADKRVYGTLCCFSAAPRAELVQADLDKLRMCATLVARKVELNVARGVNEPPPDWKLEPKAEYDAAGWRRASTRADQR